MSIDVNLNLKTIGGESIRGFGDIPIPSAALEVDETEITEAVEGAVLFVKAGKLSQIQGLKYDADTDTLSFSDNVTHENGLFVGQYEMAPGVFLPVRGVIGKNDFSLGYLDQTALGGNIRGHFGFRDNSYISVVYDGQVSLTAIENVNIDSEEDIALNSGAHILLIAAEVIQLETNDNITINGALGVSIESANLVNISSELGVSIFAEEDVQINSNASMNIYTETFLLLEAHENIGISATTYCEISAESIEISATTHQGIIVNGLSKIFIDEDQWQLQDLDATSPIIRHHFDRSGSFMLGEFLKGDDTYFGSSDDIHKFSNGGVFSIDGGTISGTGTGTLAFFGEGPIPQPTLPLGSTADAIITTLQALGLVKES